MTWQAVAAVLGGIVLLGAAIRSLPTLWRFLEAAAKAPLTIRRMAAEFAPNGGGSMRDKINTLTDDAQHLRATTHKTDATVGLLTEATEMAVREIRTHTAEDAAQFARVLERLDGLEHSVQQFNEIDRLGSEGRIDRRHQ